MHTPSCLDCIIRRHRSSFSHRIQKWDATSLHFENTTLLSLGYMLHLGHEGERCPSSPLANFRILTIADTNGIHRVKVHWCACHGRLTHGDDIQLMESGMFPSTVKRPGVAFTFRLLKYFQKLHSIAKTTATEFMKFLRHLTNSVSPSNVPVSKECADSRSSSRAEFRLVACRMSTLNL